MRQSCNLKKSMQITQGTLVKVKTGGRLVAMAHVLGTCFTVSASLTHQTFINRGVRIKVL